MLKRCFQNRDAKWVILVSATLLSIYVYTSMEWLFIVTKPSFMSAMPWVERLRILFVAPLAVALVVLLPLIFFSGIALASRNSRVFESALAVLTLVPSLFLSCLLLLLFDNLTYTVMGFGIRILPPGASWPYLVLLVMLVVYVWILLWGLQKRPAGNSVQVSFVAALVSMLLVISILFWITGANVQDSWFDANATHSDVAKTLPNILLIGSDGVNAENMSLYGYERDTTPFLQEFANDSLVCQNAYSNAGSTGASIASILTGKLPTTTRLVYPPDVLRGHDAYQHLPGLLRNYGYRLIDISLRHYADAFDLNMRNSFDRSNGRDAPAGKFYSRLEAHIGSASAYFLDQLWDRILSRLKHIAGYSAMDDSFEQVAESKTSYLQERARIQELQSFIEAGEEPFFAHLHLMGTHGPFFKPRGRHFSSGTEQRQRFMTDFYDDAIRDFDRYAREIVEWLLARDLLNRTVVIIGSDHGKGFKTVVRIPLLFRFPDSEYAGVIQTNVQNLDIGPTILDYIGIEIPDWMEGHSLISGELDPRRPIFGSRMQYSAQTRVEGLFQLDPAQLEGPFHSLGTLSLVFCEYWYEIRLRTREVLAGRVEGHTSPCNLDLSQQTAQEMLLEHLAARGYDLSSYLVPVQRK